MKKIHTAAVLAAVALLFCSCVENSKNNESGMKSLSANVSTRAIGVGVNEDLALMDSYSSYYALKLGVRYAYDNGKIKMNMDFANVPIENLAGSKVSRPWNGFVLYEYPYSGALSVRSANVKKLSASYHLTKPFSFLSKMLAKSLLRNYEGETGKKTGTLYFTSLDYRVNAGDSVDILAEIILAEDAAPGDGK